VVAAAQSFAGNYRLNSKFTAHDLPACTYSQALDLNGGYIQKLNLGSCKAANGQPVDYYGFTLSADSLVLAVVTSSDVDGFLTLYDASGNIVRTDDNNYGGMDPLIVQYLPAGAYKLAVRDARAVTGGLYQVDLRTVPGPRPPLCTSRATLPLGGSVSGNITYTGCQYTDQTFADLYQMTLAAEATVDIRLNATEFDPYLIVLDAKGNVVEDDDDGGGNTNSRITRAFPAGTYYVVTKPFGDYVAHGAYTLSAKTVE
jgi:serine protease Do